MADEELIKKFVDQHSETEKLLNQEKLKDAKQKYLDVVNTYHEIQKSQLENYHKEIAYDQVTTLFKKVNETKERVKIPYHLIIAAVLIMTFSILIFVNPSIVGLAGLENTARQQVSLQFKESGVEQVTLKDRPLSIMASGQFTGSAKLYYKQGEKLELILDTNKIQGTTFKDICLETCEVISSSNTIDLFAQLEPGATLTINEIAYNIKTGKNTPPVWKTETRTFNAQNGKPLELNLDEHFTDAEKDNLVYLSTTTDGIDVMVEENTVTITPRTTGKKEITLIASDLEEITRIPVTIEVK